MSQAKSVLSLNRVNITVISKPSRNVYKLQMIPENTRSLVSETLDELTRSENQGERQVNKIMKKSNTKTRPKIKNQQ